MNSAQRLLLLCAAIAAILLCLVVPFRGRLKGQNDWIAYSFVWDPPYAYKASASPRIPYCPDGGPSIPGIALELLALGFVGLGVHQWLGRDDAKLEKYPGYQRGF